MSRRASAAGPDPRSIITPDAFEVSPELLGLPLATPSRRLLAMLVDLVVIGIVTLLFEGLGVVLGVAAALFFVWMASRREGADRVFTWAFRLAVGCLGLLILVGTIFVAWLFGWGLRSGPDIDLSDVPGAERGVVEGIGRGALLRAVASGITAAPDARHAREVMEATAEMAFELGMEEERVREVLRGAVPGDAPWAAESEALIEEAVATGRSEAGRPPAEPASPAAGDTVGADTAAVETVAADTATTDTSLAGGAEAAVAAGTALLPGGAEDTVSALLGRLDSLAEENAELRDENEELAEDVQEREEELQAAEAEDRGFLDRLRDLVDDLGLGFGWAALYFAFVMPRMNGQTIGKRLFHCRVVQLDGTPMNWWESFERAGGYAAGFATGLLGFLQVYWDPNRQGIHDRIAGTVVIRTDLPKVPGAWRAAAPLGGDRPPPTAPTRDRTKSR